MGITKGTHVAMQTQERLKRLSTQTPTLRMKSKITESSALSLINPLSTTIVTQESFDYCMRVLSEVAKTSKSKAKTIANFISSDISLGIANEVTVDYSKYDIDKSYTDIIDKGLTETAICQRIINNQSRLQKRFNLDKIVNENRYNLAKIISELCELIDTYEVPDFCKYNVALENIAYTMAKNGVEIDNDMSVISEITEYFLLRNMDIPDATYKKYKEVLENNIIYDLSNPSPIVSAMLESNGNYFKTEVEQVLKNSNDIYISEYLCNNAMKISTEALAVEYIEDVNAYIESSNLLDNDKGRLYFSINNISNYAPVSKEFIDIKKADTFNLDDFDKLATQDSILPKDQIISEDDNKDIFSRDKYINAFKESETFAASSDIESLLAKYKAEQDKSPSKIKSFIDKLHTKSPESIINEVPSVMSFVRVGILLAVATITPIGPIIAGVLGLVSWLISRKINDKEGTRLLNTIRSEKKKINDKIDKTSNEKKKQELESYLKCLKQCENKVESYLDSLSTDDHVDDDDFDLGDDIDFGLESSLLIVNSILESSVSIMGYTADYVELSSVITEMAKNNILSDFSDIVKYSSISVTEFAEALSYAKNGTGDVKIRTAISAELDKLHETKDYYNGVRSILIMEEATNIIEEMTYQVLNEKFSLNTVKLALQNAKAKIKDLNTKQKSMWQSVDATGSGMVKSIEKAMTSDRREAIIKGSIIPSFSKCIKGAIGLAGAGILFGPTGALISAIGGLAMSKALNARERKLLFDEIDTELKVVEKQIEIAQNDGDMNQYRFLLNYQKKLTREYQRIRYGFKVQGRDIPQAAIPGKGGN